jgi:hypothetical protein
MDLKTTKESRDKIREMVRDKKNISYLDAGNLLDDVDVLLTDAQEVGASFVLRWKADMRAIQRWREAHPDNELFGPDHADLCVWLMEQLEQK